MKTKDKMFEEYSDGKNIRGSNPISTSGQSMADITSNLQSLTGVNFDMSGFMASNQKEVGCTQVNDSKLVVDEPVTRSKKAKRTKQAETEDDTDSDMDSSSSDDEDDEAPDIKRKNS